MHFSDQILGLVAEDEETGRLVGFVRWKVVDRGGPLRTGGGGGEGGDNVSVAPLFRPKKHLEGIWKRFCVKDEEMEGCYREAAGQERHFCKFELSLHHTYIDTNERRANDEKPDVEHLMIDPAHQKQGIGRMLLSTVLEKARRGKLATFLASSAESFGLYTALGFVDLGRWVVDNGFWMSEVGRREEMGIVPEGERERGKMYEGVWEVENVMVKRP